MISEHLQNIVDVGKVESFQPLDPHNNFEPELYEKKTLTFIVEDRTFTVKTWVPSSTTKPEYRDLVPVNKYLLDVTVHSKDTNMHYECQLDLRDLSIKNLTKHGSEPFDASDPRLPFGMKDQLLSYLSRFALKHLYQVFASDADRTTYQQPEHLQT